MTPLSCSLIVRALVGPALLNDPLSCSLIVRAFVGPALLHYPPLSASHRHSNTRFSKSPRNKTGVVFFRWFLPDWCTINILRYSRCFSEDAILCCFSVVTRCTSPLRMVLCVHVLSRVCFVLRILASYSSGPTLALQSLTLTTYRYY